MLIKRDVKAAKEWRQLIKEVKGMNNLSVVKRVKHNKVAF